MTDKEIEVIVKPIFTKMFNANFSACDYGIECYKKGMEYQGIKELAIENENLIKRVRKLEEQIEIMKCPLNCKNGSVYNWSDNSICMDCEKVRPLHEDNWQELCKGCEYWEIKGIKEND